jgi:hypothetical protein
MAIRKILFVVAGIVVLVGASQIVFAAWWVDRIPRIAASGYFYLLGLPGLLFGVVLLIGIMERAVGLRFLLTVVAILSMIVGGVLLAQPEFVRDILDAVFVNRSHLVQVFDSLLGGLVRTVVGALLLYALIKPEGRAPSAVHDSAREHEPGSEP